MLLRAQNNIIKALNIFNYLSIDVAFCAALNLLVLHRLHNTPHGFLYSLLLFGLTLFIYWFDHYLDSKNNNFILPSKRHLYVYKYKKVLFFFMACALPVMLYFFLSSFNRLLLPGLGAMLLLLLLYFSRSFIPFTNKIISKELLVSCIYAIAINVVVLTYNLNMHTLVAVLLMFLAVLQNMLMVNIKEQQTDITNKCSNLALVLGTSKTKKILRLLILTSLSITVMFVIYSENSKTNQYIILINITALVQQILVSNNCKHYRIAGEWAFILPAALLMMY